MNTETIYPPELRITDDALDMLLSSGLELANEIIDFRSHMGTLLPQDEGHSRVTFWNYRDKFVPAPIEMQEIVWRLYHFEHGYFKHFVAEKQRSAYCIGDIEKENATRPDWAN